MAFQFHKSEKINTQWMILLLGLVLMASKFLAFYITRSNAILSDALESIVNIVAGCFGLYSLYLSAKPRDFDHPYGHGRIEFISSSVEGVMIVIAGIIIIHKSVQALITPHPLNDLGVGIILISISGILNYFMGLFAIKRGKKTHSLALEASGEHLISDAYSTVGILVGLFLIFLTGYLWIDNIVALLMGLLIIYNGGVIIKKATAGIMDEADFDLNQKVIDHINEHRVPEWIDVHNFRIIKYGEVIHIDCHMTMPWYYTLQESHDKMKNFEACLDVSLTNPVETFIHIDPCIPISCTICQIQDCAVRQKEFIKKVEWTLENIIQNQKHS